MASRFRRLGLLFGLPASSRLQRAAQEYACQNVDDAEACKALAAEIADIPRVDVERAIDGWFRREDFIMDRAYRLLVGVRDGGAVPPIPNARRERFERDSLGLVPVPEAFGRLAKSAAILREFEVRVRAGERVEVEALSAVLKRLSDEHGPAAISIVQLYLIDCSHQQIDNRSLFMRTHSVSYFGRLLRT